MKQLILTLNLILIAGAVMGQKVGIGTVNPQKLFSVDGSILLDQGNKNYGTLDSAALRIGTTTGVGISSNRMNGGYNLNGLDFWTNNIRRMSLTSSGYLGINFPANMTPSYILDVNGIIHSKTSIMADYDFIANQDIYAGDDLHVTDDATINGNLKVDGYAAIGTNPSSSYRLNVNGNLLVDTNLGVNGNARVDGTCNLGGKITNEGKGIMLSNTSATLRTGLNKGIFTLSLAAGAFVDVTFIVTPFEGNNDNIRTMVAQFVPGSGASNWGCVVMQPHTVNPSDPVYGNQSTCQIRFHNTGSTFANLGTNATLYLLSVVTN